MTKIEISTEKDIIKNIDLVSQLMANYRYKDLTTKDLQVLVDSLKYYTKQFKTIQTKISKEGK